MNITLSRILALIEQQCKYENQFLSDMGYGKSIISDWKSGKSKSYLKKLPEIANYLGTTSAYLLGETDDPTPTERSGDAERLYAVLVEAGIVKPGEDLTDKQLVAIADVMKANSELIRKIAEDYYSNKR